LPGATLVNNCRNLSIFFNAILDREDKENRIFFAKTISNYPFALKNHLRDLPVLDELDETEEGERRDLSNFDHVPSGHIESTVGKN
jgi:putative membrane protein